MNYLSFELPKKYLKFILYFYNKYKINYSESGNYI